VEEEEEEEEGERERERGAAGEELEEEKVEGVTVAGGGMMRSRTNLAV
jgi:hypothetical protein